MKSVFVDSAPGPLPSSGLIVIFPAHRFTVETHSNRQTEQAQTAKQHGVGLGDGEPSDHMIREDFDLTIDGGSPTGE